MIYYAGGWWTYIVIVLPFAILAMIAQIKVKSTFSKYSKVLNSRGITGADAAHMVLRANNVSDLNVNQVSGELTDNYNPRTNEINLSQPVYGSTSVASLGVACHEAGHAVQYAVGYSPVKFRMAIIPFCNITSQLALPLILIGILIDISTLAWVGVAFYAVATVFQLVTLPVEFDASKRAMKCIEQSGFTQEDIKGARSVLSAAAMTYVAALFVSLASLLRLIIMVSGNRRN